MNNSENIEISLCEIHTICKIRLTFAPQFFFRIAILYQKRWFKKPTFQQKKIEKYEPHRTKRQKRLVRRLFHYFHHSFYHGDNDAYQSWCATPI